MNEIIKTKEEEIKWYKISGRANFRKEPPEVACLDALSSKMNEFFKRSNITEEDCFNNEQKIIKLCNNIVYNDPYYRFDDGFSYMSIRATRECLEDLEKKSVSDTSVSDDMRNTKNLRNICINEVLLQGELALFNCLEALKKNSISDNSISDTSVSNNMRCSGVFFFDDKVECLLKLREEENYLDYGVKISWGDEDRVKNDLSLTTKNLSPENTIGVAHLKVKNKRWDQSEPWGYEFLKNFGITPLDEDEAKRRYEGGYKKNTRIYWDIFGKFHIEPEEFIDEQKYRRLFLTFPCETSTIKFECKNNAAAEIEESTYEGVCIKKMPMENCSVYVQK